MGVVLLARLKKLVFTPDQLKKRGRVEFILAVGKLIHKTFHVEFLRKVKNVEDPWGLKQSG